MSYDNSSKIETSCDVCGKELSASSCVEVGNKKYCEDCINEIINVGIATKVNKIKAEGIEENSNNNIHNTHDDNTSSNNNNNNNEILEMNSKSNSKEDLDLNDIYSDSRIYDEIHNEEDSKTIKPPETKIDNKSSKYLGQEQINPLNNSLNKNQDNSTGYQSTINNIDNLETHLKNNSLNKVEGSEEKYIREKYGELEARENINESEEDYIKQKYGFLLDELEDPNTNTPNIQNQEYNTDYDNYKNTANIINVEKPDSSNESDRIYTNHDNYNMSNNEYGNYDNYNNHNNIKSNKRSFDPSTIGNPVKESKNAIPESRTKLISKWKKKGNSENKKSKKANTFKIGIPDTENEKTIQFILTAILVVLIFVVATYVIYILTLAGSYNSFGEAIGYLFTDPCQVFSKMFGG
ncbi:MAG: LIM domain-containing protein [Methanobacteriaceae archaeon]